MEKNNKQILKRVQDDSEGVRNDNDERNKQQKNIWTKRVLYFVLIFLCAFGIFLEGYLVGTKGINLGIVSEKILTTNSNQPSNVDFSTFWQAWNLLKEKSVAKTDNTKMKEGAISGMLSSLNDPYTVYFTKEEKEQFGEDMSGDFDGIGIEIVEKNGLATVVAPLSGSPAEKAGLKANDIITAVDGTSASSMTFSELISKIRGKAGTTVELKILRDKDEFTVKITRQNIVIKSVKWEEKNYSGKKYMYIQITQFGDDTQSLFAQAANQVLKDKPDGIILDIRDNPGGYLETAVNIASYFISDGTIVSEKGKGDANETYSAIGNATLKDYGKKTVLLVNGGSASASEILSGAMRDRLGAKLIGEKTFGKGCVQELIDLSDGSAVKITVANWYTPSGKNISDNGLEPDLTVEVSTDSSTDTQLNKAEEYLFSK